MTMVGGRRQLLAQILRSRQAQLIFVISVVIANVYLFYKSGRSGTIVPERGKIQREDDVDKRRTVAEKDVVDVVDQGQITLRKHYEVTAFEVNVILPFTNVEKKSDLQKKFKICLESMLTHTSIPVALHIIGDEKSWAIANKYLLDFQSRSTRVTDRQHRIIRQDVMTLANRLSPMVQAMQRQFSYKPGNYYSHPLFFLSLALHKVLPNTLDKVIMLDADLKFNADVSDLYAEFSNFQESNVIGLAHEQQPVYRHTFQIYRDKHPGTSVGESLPNGHPGYNSGVLLLDLQRMRQSKLYNDLLDASRVEDLAKKYIFKGHLGDQDFFTLVSMEHMELFYTLPCNWNRQLCQWWKNKGYQSVFDRYYNCTGTVHIYHGNCDTPIPVD